MAPFGRRRAEPDDGPRDDGIDFLSRTQADTLRSLMRVALAERGLEATVHADHMVDSGGSRYGLRDLAARCRSAKRGEREWPRIVRAHVATLSTLYSQNAAVNAMSREKALARTYPRVVGPDRGPAHVRHAVPVVGELVEVLNLDLPSAVRWYTDQDVERWGPYDALHRAALDNLRTVKVDKRMSIDEEQGNFEVLIGESMFLASMVLVLPDLLRRIGLTADPELGLFVAMPYRHMLILHVIRDDMAIPSLTMLAPFVTQQCAGSPGPISPDVFWWQRGHLRQVTRRDGDDIMVSFPDDLAEMLSTLPPRQR